MSDDKAKPQELADSIDYSPNGKTWLDPTVEFRKGTFNYGSNPDSVEYLSLPYARKFDPREGNLQKPEGF